MASLDDAQTTLSMWLLSNRLYAWTVTLLILFTTITAVPVSLIDDAQSKPAWVTIVAVLLMAYGAAGAVFYPRLVGSEPHEVLGISWAFAVGTVLIGLSMSVWGAGRWLPGFGFLLAIASLFLAMRQAQQSVAEVDRYQSE